MVETVYDRSTCTDTYLLRPVNSNLAKAVHSIAQYRITAKSKIIKKEIHEKGKWKAR